MFYRELLRLRRGNGEGSIITLSGKRRRPYAVRVTEGWTPEGKQKYKYIIIFSSNSIKHCGKVPVTPINAHFFMLITCGNIVEIMWKTYKHLCITMLITK